MVRTTSRLALLAYATPFLLFLAVYVPAAGHGFISDDFMWILHHRVRRVDDIWRVVLNDTGFYRPAVALSFSANEWLFGLNPRPYGLTNVALATLCGAAVYALCRSLRMPSGASAFGAALWLLNVHGINMAVLWISGRTTLIATAAAAGCMAALLRGRNALAAGLFGIAIFAREETSLLPLVAAAWLALLRGDLPFAGAHRAHRRLFLGSAIILLYFGLRSTTHAMTPFDAPAFYRFTTSAPVLLRNVAQYADRTMTFSAGLLLLALFVLRPRFRNLDGITQRIVACGFVWLAVFLLPASVLPVRSSLYACLPSVGVSVAAAAIVGHWWSRAPDRRRQRALICAVLLPVLVWPIYLARAQRWVRMAEFSTQALSELQSAASALPDNSGILIIDDRTVRANVASVFSTVLRDSFLLMSGRYMTFYVRPPVDNADPQNGGAAACGGCVDVTLVVKDGRLTRQ